MNLQDPICFQPIGVIHSPFYELDGMPIQPSGAKGRKGSINVNMNLMEGLKDLDGFSHIVLLYHLHKSKDYSLVVKPFLDDQKRGVFATRAPKRPNAIGMSVVRLTQIVKNTLYIEDVDILDGTPLLDIKPYVPVFENSSNVRTGWLEKKGTISQTCRSDNRFSGCEK